MPADYVTEGELSGKNYATQTWVGEQGFLTEVPADYVTETELTGKNYATQTWVEN